MKCGIKLLIHSKPTNSCWMLGIDISNFIPLYWACNYLSMLGLKLIHDVSKRAHICAIKWVLIWFEITRLWAYDALSKEALTRIKRCCHLFLTVHAENCYCIQQSSVTTLSISYHTSVWSINLFWCCSHKSTMVVKEATDPSFNRKMLGDFIMKARVCIMQLSWTAIMLCVLF